MPDEEQSADFTGAATASESAPKTPGAPPRPAAADSVVDPHRALDVGPPSDSDSAWGDEAGGYDDDWYLRERPPHHE